MSSTNTTRNAPASAVAAVFLIGVGSVLFRDVIDGAPISTAHVLTALALLGSVASSHMIPGAWRNRRPGLLVGLVALNIAALTYCAAMSAGRNGEQVAAKAERIVHANAERARVRAALDAAEAQAEKDRAAAKRQCASGKGTKCQGETVTRQASEARVAALTARLAALGSPQTPNSLYRSIATSAATIGISIRPVDELEAVLAAAMPWLAVLIGELGLIVFAVAGLGHTPATRQTTAQLVAASAPTIADTIADRRQTSFPAAATAEIIDFRQMMQREIDPLEPTDPEPSDPNGGKRRRKTSADNVVPFGKHPVIATLERAGGTVASNRELAQLMGVSDGESTKRVREVAHLIETTREGKQVRISLRPARRSA